MRVPLLKSNIADYFQAFFVIILLCWISFFPEPVQAKYRVYAIIFFGIFLLILILNKKYLRLLFGFKDWPLWLFLICLLSGTVSATNKEVALRTYLYLVTTLLPLFYIGKYLYLFDNERNRISLVICICSGLVALMGILEVIFAFNPIYEYVIDNPFYERDIIRVFVRPMSTQLNFAPLATYLLLTLPFAIHIAKEKSLAKRRLGYIVIVLNITCLLSTLCRGSFLGLIFMLFFYQCIREQYKKLRIIFLIFIIFLIIVSFLPYPFNQLSPKGIGIYKTGVFSDYRLIRTRMSWEMLKDSPLFGVGLNHLRILFDKYYPFKAEVRYIPYEKKIADNMYLTLMAETGIIGLTGFLIFALSLFKKGIKHFRSLRDGNKKQILLAPILALTGLIVSMGGYELFYWSNPYMLFCLICGLIQGAVEKT